METLLLEMDDASITESLKKAGALIRQGETVVFPTETVYGLGANALDGEAVKKIFLAKGRPGDNPLIVHIAEVEAVDGLVAQVPEKARALMDAFWPGPLTLIMARGEIIPEEVTAGLSTVAIRLPSGDIAHRLIQEAGVPIAAPSANISGRPSPTKGEHVLEDMLGKVSAILIREDVEVGLESTVVDMTTEPPTLLRPGGITVRDLTAVIGEVDISPNITENVIPEEVKSPGMKYTHYSPEGEVLIVKGTDEERVAKISSHIKVLAKNGDTSIGILATDETMGNYHKGIIISLGSREDPAEMSRNLFDRLRIFDEMKVKHIFAEDIPVTNDTLAIINRLYKSAGYQFI